MAREKVTPLPTDAPAANFARGMREIAIPQFGPPAMQGKVRDVWVFGKGASEVRVLATSDRLSAYDHIICAVPGKGQALNLTAFWWFEQTADIIPNHVIAVPHSNIVVAQEAVATLPVELVVRRHMARSSTSTSVFDNYHRLGRRTIYGIDFPDNLAANQEFPMGTIITPTTKAQKGHHDQELTDTEARAIVDGELGGGVWDAAKEAAIVVFERGYAVSRQSGLILADTKYEMGVNARGELMLIDEVHTPDSSRYWKADSYETRMAAGQNPEGLDKETVRRWLAEHGYTGEGPIPVVDPGVIDQVSLAYQVPYRMLTGEELPQQTPVDEIAVQRIREAVGLYLG